MAYVKMISKILHYGDHDDLILMLLTYISAVVFCKEKCTCT